MKFTLEIPIRLSHTDAGKVMYFAQYLSLSHQVYEAFLDSRGFSVGRIIDEGEFAMPIVHAEADYKAPVKVSDVLRFELTATLGDSSVRSHFDIYRGDKVVAQSKMVSVCISQKTGQKISLPEDFRAALSA